MVNPMTRFSRRFPLWLAGICILGFQSKTAAENKVVRPAKYATEHNWSINPSEDLSQPGNMIVSLPSSSGRQRTRGGILGLDQRARNQPLG
jgi:hypothetical protein